MAQLSCICGTSTGSLDLGNEFLVCNRCLKPSHQWVETQGDEVLNYFHGGPMDGLAYETSTLLADNTLPIIQYRWTSEVKVSATTGRKARVWEWNPPLNRPEEKAGKPASAPPKKREEIAMSELLERRKNLKVSRAQLSEKSGISQAKIARIERESERNTEEEVQALRAALDAFAAEVPPAEDAEAPADPQE